MKKIIRVTVFAAIGILFIWTLYFLYAQSEKKPMVYTTHTPFISNIIKKTVATGSISPEQKIDMKSKVSGIVDKLYKEAGDYVKKGEVIARIKIIPDMANLNAAESRVKKAKIALDNAKVDYDRNKKLLDKGVIAKADFQTYALAYHNAEEEMNAAQDNLQITKQGSTKDSGDETNTLIRSTISGMILDVPVKEGNSVIESNTFNDGTTIATVADMKKMIFDGQVDESEVGKLKEGMDIILSIGAIEGKTFHATLNYISPQGVNNDGAIQFEIKAKVAVSDSVFIRAGYSANADIVLARADSVMTISESWLQFDKKNNPYVEIETSPQVFKKQPIKTGLSDGINVQVLSGLKMTDKIKDPNSGTTEKKKKSFEGHHHRASI